MNTIRQRDKWTIQIGIDWADRLHAYHVLGTNGPQHGFVEQTPADIDALLSRWRNQFPDATFAVAIEQSKGALINSLYGHDDVTIYPINPAALASYRKAFAHGGGKNDPSDAQLLAQYLQHYRAQMRPLRMDSSQTRELTMLGEDRRRMVDQRTAHCNELKAVLKQYFPAVLQLGAAKIYADFIVRYLLKYSTLEDAQQLATRSCDDSFLELEPNKRPSNASSC